MDQDGAKHQVVRNTIRNMRKDLDLVTERVNDKREAFGTYSFSGYQAYTNQQPQQQEQELDEDTTSKETASFHYEERRLQKDSRLCGTFVEDVKSRAGDFQQRFDQFKLMFGIVS